MTHAAGSSTQALTVIVTFGKWVKARGSCRNVFYRAEKKYVESNMTLRLLSLKLDTLIAFAASAGATVVMKQGLR